MSIAESQYIGQIKNCAFQMEVGQGQSSCYAASPTLCTYWEFGGPLNIMTWSQRMSACEGFSPLGPQGSPLTAIGPAPSPAVFFFFLLLLLFVCFLPLISSGLSSMQGLNKIFCYEDVICCGHNPYGRLSFPQVWFALPYQAAVFLG